jgi:hypothetical protein
LETTLPFRLIARWTILHVFAGYELGYDVLFRYDEAVDGLHRVREARLRKAEKTGFVW